MKYLLLLSAALLTNLTTASIPHQDHKIHLAPRTQNKPPILLSRSPPHPQAPTLPSRTSPPSKFPTLRRTDNHKQPSEPSKQQKAMGIRLRVADGGVNKRVSAVRLEKPKVLNMPISPFESLANVNSVKSAKSPSRSGGSEGAKLGRMGSGDSTGQSHGVLRGADTMLAGHMGGLGMKGSGGME